MKKTLALVLACLMVLSAVSVMAFTVSAETVTLAGTKWADGMENWSGATQILYGIVPDEGTDTATLEGIYAAKADYTWTLQISTNADMTDAVTKVMTPASSIGTYNEGKVYFRFTPCLAEGENQFVPVKDTVYYIDLTIAGADTTYEVTGDEAGYKLANVDPIVPAPAPAGTVELTGSKYGSGMENWVNSDNNPAGKGNEPGVTEILFGVNTSDTVSADTLTALWGAKADYTWTLKIATKEDMSDAVTKVIAPASSFTTGATSRFFRFEPCLVEGDNQWVPVKNTVYYINLTIAGADVVYEVTGDATGYSMDVDPVVPETADPEPDPEPQGPTYKVNGTVLTVLADVVGEGEGEARVFPWTELADKITKVVVAKGVTKIDQRAFTKFPNLEEVVIADTVTEIGQDAFSYNEKLTTLTIPTSVTTIGQGIVYSSNAITTIYGDWESAEAFKAIWSVKNYNESFEAEGVTIKTYEDYTLVDGVLTLYKDIEADTEDAYPWAADKDSIKKIVIWDTVTTVGARAFSHCNNLEEVVVGNGVLVLKQDAFSYCPKLATITIPSTVGEIGQGIVFSSGAITTVYGGWETAEEFKAIWSVKDYNDSFEGEGVEYLVIGTVKEPPVDPDPKPPVDPDPKPPVDPDDPTTDPDDPTTDPGTTDEEEGGFPVWAIVVIVIAVVAVAAGVVVVLKKKKD